MPMLKIDPSQDPKLMIAAISSQLPGVKAGHLSEEDSTTYLQNLLNVSQDNHEFIRNASSLVSIDPEMMANLHLVDYGYNKPALQSDIDRRLLQEIAITTPNERELKHQKTYAAEVYCRLNGLTVDYAAMESLDDADPIVNHPWMTGECDAIARSSNGELVFLNLEKSGTELPQDIGDLQKLRHSVMLHQTAFFSAKSGTIENGGGSVCLRAVSFALPETQVQTINALMHNSVGGRPTPELLQYVDTVDMLLRSAEKAKNENAKPIKIISTEIAPSKEIVESIISKGSEAYSSLAQGESPMPTKVVANSELETMNPKVRDAYKKTEIYYYMLGQVIDDLKSTRQAVQGKLNAQLGQIANVASHQEVMKTSPTGATVVGERIHLNEKQAIDHLESLGVDVDELRKETKVDERAVKRLLRDGHEVTTENTITKGDFNRDLVIHALEENGLNPEKFIARTYSVRSTPANKKTVSPNENASVGSLTYAALAQAVNSGLLDDIKQSIKDKTIEVARDKTIDKSYSTLRQAKGHSQNEIKFG